MVGIHSRKHEFPVDGCFTCKVATIRIGDLQDINRQERAFSADQDAYKRLRKDGLQPNSPEGAAEVERKVKDQLEIDYRIPLSAADLPRAKEIQAALTEHKASVERAW